MTDREQQDIDFLIKEIEHIRTNLNDPSLGPVFWEEAMKDLISRHGGMLIELLNELGKKRAAEIRKNSQQG